VPTRDTIRLASELPEAQLVVVKHAGHLPHEECPTIFLDAVQDFLDKLAEHNTPITPENVV
jgi:pimeloyl-ACP methyl ester carboxylesterase